MSRRASRARAHHKADTPARLARATPHWANANLELGSGRRSALFLHERTPNGRRLNLGRRRALAARIVLRALLSSTPAYLLSF